jgi:hypothetical protein
MAGRLNTIGLAQSVAKNTRTNLMLGSAAETRKSCPGGLNKCRMNHTFRDRHTLKVVARFNARKQVEDVPKAATSFQGRENASVAASHDINLSRRVTQDDDLS